MTFVSIKDKLPPKDIAFLALTDNGIVKMIWTECIVNGNKKGWFKFDSACQCCSGFCSSEFEYWMPLPETSK